MIHIWQDESDHIRDVYICYGFYHVIIYGMRLYWMILS